MELLRKYICEKNVIKDALYESVENSITCLICLDIIIDPIVCMSCHHSFCNSCIHKWLSNKKICPNRCGNTKYQNNLEIKKLLSKIKFSCKKCKNAIFYDEMIKHCLSKCKLGNNKVNKTLNQTNFKKIDEDDTLKREPETKLTSKIIFFLLLFYLYSYNFGF